MTKTRIACPDPEEPEPSPVVWADSSFGANLVAPGQHVANTNSIWAQVRPFLPQPYGRPA